jgi:hypothetical protein
MAMSVLMVCCCYEEDGDGLDGRRTATAMSALMVDSNSDECDDG